MGTTEALVSVTAIGTVAIVVQLVSVIGKAETVALPDASDIWSGRTGDLARDYRSRKGGESENGNGFELHVALFSILST